MNRCYGNPVPRRNAHDNSTDMTSFPFIRHHFLRSGFEVVDCPPLTAQLKNSSDIRMVMDLRDYLTHPTYFDEFIILSGDADFTPVLHRLRQHARRTVIYANDYTAVPYTAICDGEVREADLIALLLGNKDAETEPAAPALAAPITITTSAPPAATAPRQAPSAAAIRSEIIGEVVVAVRASMTPVPLEALADRAVRALGHGKTIDTGWAGAGSFRELLRQSLPAEIRLTDQPPYAAYDPRRHDLSPPPAAIEPPRQQPFVAPRQELRQNTSAKNPSAKNCCARNRCSAPNPMRCMNRRRALLRPCVVSRSSSSSRRSKLRHPCSTTSPRHNR